LENKSFTKNEYISHLIDALFVPVSFMIGLIVTLLLGLVLESIILFVIVIVASILSYRFHAENLREIKSGVIE
jgi:hypothetical protein